MARPAHGLAVKRGMKMNDVRADGHVHRYRDVQPGGLSQHAHAIERQVAVQDARLPRTGPSPFPAW